jgi:hypothetical protein
MLAGSSASAALGCSPPVKSASVPIGPGRSRLWSRSSSTSAGEDARRGGTSERSGEPVGSAGGRRLSFNSTSYSRTPSASAAARPPVPTAPCVQVGFAPAAPAPVNGLPSPGRLATKSSLLSAALLDEPAHGVELFGSAAPAAAFTVRAFRSSHVKIVFSVHDGHLCRVSVGQRRPAAQACPGTDLIILSMLCCVPCTPRRAWWCCQSVTRVLLLLMP